MVIGIHGSIGEGKDTFTQMFIDLTDGYVNKKFADKLKKSVGVLFNVDPINFENDNFKNTLAPLPWKHPKTSERITYRFLLQYIGTDLFRDNFDTNIWVNSLLGEY